MTSGASTATPRRQPAASVRTAPLSTAETVGLWALALVFAVACAFLGRWQWHRYEAKHEKSDLVERNTAARVVPLEEPAAATRPRRPHDVRPAGSPTGASRWPGATTSTARCWCATGRTTAAPGSRRTGTRCWCR
nr:SURF1 family cytochrome oxidase biogenesis protein [Angustibacter aerolatus]